MRVLRMLLMVIGLVSCGTAPLGDVTPPLLLKSEISDDGREVALSFDEPLEQAETAVDHGVAVTPDVVGTVVKVPLPPDLKPGTGHVWSAEVSDGGKNITSVAGKFYAPNPRPADVRLNEVRVAGSGAHTDMVELRVEAPGSLAGWTVEAWSGPQVRQRTVLPDVEVTPGQFIVVRYKAPADATDAAPGSREFWQAEAKGLGATKGLVLLRRNPDAEASDGLLYAKKPGDAQAIAAAAGWNGPELDSSGCTATRTWCRTDGDASVWIVSATGGATPGAPNKLTPWQGPPSNRGGTSKSKGRRRHPRRAATARGRRSPPGSSASREGRAGGPP